MVRRTAPPFVAPTRRWSRRAGDLTHAPVQDASGLKRLLAKKNGLALQIRLLSVTPVHTRRLPMYLPRGMSVIQIGAVWRAGLERAEAVFRHACKMGMEGIVSKRRASRYRSGRSRDWLKFENPRCAGEAGGGGRRGK